MASLAFATLPGSAAADEHHSQLGYQFGVFPYLPALTIDRVFGPVAARFAADLKQPFYVKTKFTFEQFHQELEKETYDVIFVHPYFYTDAADHHNYVPLARIEGKLSAVALAQEGAPWQGWSDLKGRTIAMPPELAAVSELARESLSEAGMVAGVHVTVNHMRTKMSCIRALMVGTADICVVPRFLASQLEQNAGAELVTVAETRAINHLLFAAHRRLPAEERAEMLDCILSWPRSEEGLAILAGGAWSGFVAAADADYDAIRGEGRGMAALGLPSLAQR